MNELLFISGFTMTVVGVALLAADKLDEFLNPEDDDDDPYDF